MKAGIRRIAMVIVILALLSGFPLIAYAANGNTEVSGKIYELGKDSHYVIGEASPSKSVAIGTLSINGNVRTSNETNSFPTYEISNGNASFTYKISSGALDRLFFTTPIRRSSSRKSLTRCRRSGNSVTAERKRARAVCSPAWFTVPTAERKCGTVPPITLRSGRITLYAPTTEATREAVRRTLSGRLFWKIWSGCT